MMFLILHVVHLHLHDKIVRNANAKVPRWKINSFKSYYYPIDGKQKRGVKSFDETRYIQSCELSRKNIKKFILLHISINGKDVRKFQVISSLEKDTSPWLFLVHNASYAMYCKTNTLTSKTHTYVIFSLVSYTSYNIHHTHNNVLFLLSNK